MNRSEKVLLALILSGGALLTFFYLRQFQQTPYGQFLMVDAKVYHQKALQILQEGWLGKGAFYQAPLYPYILAAIYKIFGVKIWVVQAIQGGLFLLTVVLLFQIGRALFDLRTGLVSATLAVLYGPFAYYSGLLLKETWSIFFTCGLLLVLIKAARSLSNRSFYGAGLLLGVNLALRENYFLAEAYNNLGVVYWQKSALSEARGAFREALKRNPLHPAARANLDRLTSSPPGGREPEQGR